MQTHIILDPQLYALVNDEKQDYEKGVETPLPYYFYAQWFLLFFSFDSTERVA